MFLDPSDVGRSGGSQYRSAMRGKDDEHSATIPIENLAFDETISLQPVYKSGGGAAADEQVSGQVSRSECPTSFVKLNKRVVPGQRQITFVRKFLLQSAHRTRIRLEKAAPSKVMGIGHVGTINEISLARAELYGI